MSNFLSLQFKHSQIVSGLIDILSRLVYSIVYIIGYKELERKKIWRVE